MGTVSATADLLGAVDLDVSDLEVRGVESLGLGVALSVLEEALEHLHGLTGPASLGHSELLGLGGTPGSVGETDVRHTALVVHDVLKVLLGLLEGHGAEGACHLPCVLEVDAKVRSTGVHGGLVLNDLGVLSHFEVVVL